MDESQGLLPGTLDILILEAVEAASWNRLAAAIAPALRATPREV